MAKDTRYPKYLYGKTKEFPNGILNFPNYSKAYDFPYFQAGLGLTTRDPRLKPRFIKACSQFLFDTTINDPYEQFKDGLRFLKYIFKDKKNLPSRQELANIVSVAQLIHYGFEVYKRPLNELSISLNKNKVSKRWKEVFKVDKKSRQLTDARKKVEPTKRIGKFYFKDLTKADIRERKQEIKGNQLWLKKMKKEWEVLNNRVNEIEKLMGARSTFGMTVMSRNHSMGLDVRLTRLKEQRDIKRDEILRLERTLANIDPSVQADFKINIVERHIKTEIKQMEDMMFVSKTPSTFTETGEIDIKGGGAKQKTSGGYVDWSNSSSYNRNFSSKKIWVKDRPKKK